MPTPQEVYTRLLMRRDPDRGFPLYTPEPDEGLPPDYRAHGPRIGDVGYISDRDGRFNFLFNICLPADHSFNQVYGVPETFQQVKLRVGEETDYEDVRVRGEDLPGKIVSTCPTKVVQLGGMVDTQNSSSTMGTGLTVQFNSPKNEGAMLVLPHGAEKRDLKPIMKLERAVKENAQSWYQFICANLGRRVDNNSLFVVTGYHKASSWCLASFSQETGNTGHEWQSIDSIGGRVSPRDEFDETQCKQATSLRGITITLRDCPTAMLQGGKMQVTTSPQRKNVFSRFWNPEPSEMAILNKYCNAGHTSEGQATDPDVSLHHPNLSVPLHPAVMINKYLLAKFPNADVAITYDAQWMGALEECGGPKKMIKQIRKRFVPAYDAIDAVAYFKSKAEPKFGSYNHNEQQVNKQHPSHKPHTTRQKSTICTALSHIFKCSY